MSDLGEKIRRALVGRAAARALKEAHPDLDVITPAAPRVTAREVAEDLLHPVRRNNLKTRRKKVGLSQTELATVLDVDVASIYRHERADTLPALWHYALKGVEAEAAHPDSRQVLRHFRSQRGLDRPDVMAEGLLAHGSRLVAVRMVSALRDSARANRLKRKVQRAEREAGKTIVVDLPTRKSSGEPSNNS